MCNIKRAKNAEPYQPKDFSLGEFETQRESKEKQTPEEMKSLLMGLTKQK